MDAIDQAYGNLEQKKLDEEDAINEQYASLAGLKTNPEVQNKIKQIEDKILNKPVQEVDYLGEGIAGLAPIAATLLFGGEASRIALPQTINQSRDIYGSIKKEQQQADLNQDKRLADTYGSLLKQDSADKQRQVAIQRLQQQMAAQKAQDEQKMLDREYRQLKDIEDRNLRADLFRQGDSTRRENAKLLAGIQQQNLDFKKTEEKNIPQNVSQAATFATRLQDANQQLEDLISTGYDPTSAARVGEKLLPEYFKSGEAKLAQQAQDNFINATLRRESGAAIGPKEYQNANRQYFPQIGDTPEVLAQKKRNREVVIAGMRAEGKKALDRLEEQIPAATAKSAKAQEPATFTSDKQKRLDELRKKRDAGKLGE